MPKQMRVALVLETASGGSGKHVIDLAKGLVARDLDHVIVYSPLRADEDFAAQAMAACTTPPVSVLMRKRPGLSQLKSLRNLRAIFDELRPDVIHAHSSVAGVLTRVLPKQAPLLYTPHAFKSMDPGLSDPARLAVSKIESLLSRRSRFVVAVSQAEYDHGLQLGVPQRRLRKIVNGVDAEPLLAREDAREALGVPTDGPLLGWVGRFVDQKDPVEFVRWVRATCEAMPEAHAVMVGDGPLLAETKLEASRCGLDDNLHFAGAQGAQRMMKAFDLLCMTSKYEAMPYTLLEALVAGTPIVTTAVGGTQETVSHGETGYIVNEDTVDPILPTLLQDPDKIEHFGKQSMELARTMPISGMVEETLALYHEMVRSRR